MAKVALIGFGKMGKIIKKISHKHNISVISIIDPEDRKADYKNISQESLKECDFCIDFSTPGVILDNIKKVMKFKVPMVVGTTGWYDSIDEVKEIVKENDGSLIYGSNFSIGVNMLFSIIKKSCKMLNNFPEYDVSGLEYHHRFKKDIPSGTAESLANIILSEIDNKEAVIYQPGNREIKKEELHFTSLRCGSINGMHSILFDSLEDQIEIKHTAKSREGFAKGSLVAGKFIVNNKGFYSFNESFDLIMEGGINGN